MKKIQTIHINKFIQLEALSDMYYRSDVPIFTIQDGSAKLSEGEFFDFLTYFNSLAIRRWKKYTYAENYYLILDIKGNFNLDIVGHLPAESGHQNTHGPIKQWIF